jgi:Protein of unknown function (DUF3102)
MSSSDSLNLQGSQPPHERVPHAQVLAEHAESIRKLGERVIGDVIEIGRRLSECKKLLGHGNWLPWIEREFRWSERTARNYILVYEFALSKSVNVADLAIDVSAVYLLAAPSTSEDARAEVLRRGMAGERMPHVEVKRIVGEEREREAAAGAAKHPVSIKKLLKARYGDFSRLTSVEREKILAGGPKDFDLRIADATTRQRWKPPHRELQDALDALETLAKRSNSKIIAALPVEILPAIAARVKAALDFLVKFDAKLGQHKNISRTGTTDEAASLAELLKKARRACIKKYGRPSPAQILETLWPELNPAQIELLVSGRHETMIKATAERLMQAREATE